MSASLTGSFFGIRLFCMMGNRLQESQRRLKRVQPTSTIGHQIVRSIIAFALMTVAALIHVRGLGAADRDYPEDEKIWAYLIQHRAEMTRVTSKPYHVNWAGSTLCARPNSIPHSPHGEHWIHVFVSPGGTNVMATGKGTYPIGTVILKQKFLDERGTNTDFYTG